MKYYKNPYPKSYNAYRKQNQSNILALNNP